jgi:SAM-dependent methyltransferase
MNMVIEHLEDPIGTLFKINRLLRPKGVVYIHTPNYDSLTLKLFPNYPKFFPRDHFYFFTVKTLERALKKTGFQIVWNKTRGFEFPTGKGRTPSLKRQSLRLIKNMVFPVVNILGKGDRIRLFAEKRVVS